MKLIGTLENLLAGALFAALSGAAFAHHASVEYDRSMLHEIEGELISVRWRNPHLFDPCFLQRGTCITHCFN